MNEYDFERLLREIVWRKRSEHYSVAVERGIISPEQAQQLLALFQEQIDEQERREV